MHRTIGVVIAATVIGIAGCSLGTRPGTAAPSVPAPTTAQTQPATAPPAPSSTGPAGSVSATPAPLASGSFLAKGGRVTLAAYPDGAAITGTLSYTDPQDSLDGFWVDLACMRATSGGLVMFGGTTTRTTFDGTPMGTRVALVLRPGNPVNGFIHHEYPDPPLATCPAFLGTILDFGDPAFDASVLEPIDGTVELP
jgi:hypothetical protein